MPINTQSFGNTQAHSEMDQRDGGSVTHRQDNAIRLADVQRALDGATFPANKNQLVEYAKSQQAPSHVLDIVGQLPTSEFGSPNASHLTEYNSIHELMQEINKIQPTK